MRSSSVRIGISSSLRPCEELTAEDRVGRYIQAIENTGAEPVHLPVGFDSTARIYSGELAALVLSGGADIEPLLYGGRADRCHPKRDFERDRTEIALLVAAIVLRLPVLCVCRGMQLANVVMGGTLIEDISSEPSFNGHIKHDQIRELNRPRYEYAHAVTVVGGTRLSQIVGALRFDVNSTHHQAIRDVAPGLRAAAHSDDGIVEAVEADRMPFFLGVQWHPETLQKDDNVSARLFDALVGAAVTRRGGVANSV